MLPDRNDFGDYDARWNVIKKTKNKPRYFWKLTNEKNGLNVEPKLNRNLVKTGSKQYQNSTKNGSKIGPKTGPKSWPKWDQKLDQKFDQKLI